MDNGILILLLMAISKKKQFASMAKIAFWGNSIYKEGET
jgi:hypothetical protein